MSKMLIGKVIEEDAFNRMSTDLQNNSKRFLERVREVFLSAFYKEGEVERKVYIRSDVIYNFLGEHVEKVKYLSAFVGIEFYEYKETEEKKGLLGGYYCLSIPPYVEGGMKTPAQNMWEQVVKEYQIQVRKDEAEAEHISRIVLEKLKNKEYSVDLSYPWNHIYIVVNVQYPYKKENAERYAWKAKVKSIMAENGFDLDKCSIYFENNKWRIQYPMTK